MRLHGICEESQHGAQGGGYGQTKNGDIDALNVELFLTTTKHTNYLIMGLCWLTIARTVGALWKEQKNDKRRSNQNSVGYEGGV